jgi:hypothetical protein
MTNKTQDCHPRLLLQKRGQFVHLNSHKKAIAINNASHYDIDL